jgi:hypothetical protein
MKTDLYQKVTDQIVASLERGCRPWMRPWSGDHAAGRLRFDARDEPFVVDKDVEEVVPFARRAASICCCSSTP